MATTKEEAQAAFRSYMRRYQRKTSYKYGISGNGSGKLYVNDDKNYIYWRQYGTPRPQIALNRGAIGPYIDLPIVIGFKDTEPGTEQVIGVNDDVLAQGDRPNADGGNPPAYNIGKHAEQHMFGGGDIAWVDSRRFTPGLTKPTAPISMQMTINSFYYRASYKSGGGIKYFPGSTIEDLSAYKPSGSNLRFVHIGFDTGLGSIVYRPSDIVERTDPDAGNNLTWAYLLASPSASGIPLGFNETMGDVAGDEILLGTAYLSSATSSLATTVGGSQIFDTRVFINENTQYLESRIEALEGLLGHSPDLPALGANTIKVSDGFQADAFSLQGSPISIITNATGNVLTWSNATQLWQGSGLSDAASQFLLKDGSRALTGDWDAGDYAIRNARFVIDKYTTGSMGGGIHFVQSLADSVIGINDQAGLDFAVGAYYDTSASQWKYNNTLVHRPARISLTGGQAIFQTQDTGITGNTITWTPRLTIQESSGSIFIENSNFQIQDTKDLIFSGGKIDFVQGAQVWNIGAQGTASLIFKERNGIDNGTFIFRNAADTNIFAINLTSSQISVQRGSPALPSYSLEADQDTGIYSNEANYLSIATGGTARLTATSAGNVGIGTSSPLGLLHIYSNQDITGTGPGGALLIGDETDGTYLGFDHNEIQAYVSDAAAGAILYLQNDGGTVHVMNGTAGNFRVNNDDFYVTSGGKVLIGDTSNAQNTTGLTINQGAADDEILSFKSSDISHSATGDTESDTFAYFKKYSATKGGLLLGTAIDAWNTAGTGRGFSFDVSEITIAQAGGPTAFYGTEFLSFNITGDYDKTIPTAATVYINNAPTDASEVVITDTYALWADAGNVRIDGTILLGAGTATPDTNYSLHIEESTPKIKLNANRASGGVAFSFFDGMLTQTGGTETLAGAIGILGTVTPDPAEVSYLFIGACTHASYNDTILKVHDGGLGINVPSTTIPSYALDTRGTAIFQGGSLVFKGTNPFYFGDQDGDRFIGLQAPSAIASNFIVKLPDHQGAEGTALVNDGSGNTTWARSRYLDHVTVTSNTTLTDGHNVVLCNAANGGFTITVPNASTMSGKYFHIKKIDTTASAITVNAGTDTIDGASTQTIYTPYDSMQIVSNNIDWYII